MAKIFPPPRHRDLTPLPQKGLRREDFDLPLTAPVSALNIAQTPKILRRIGRFLSWALFIAPILLLFLPWQQTIIGEGRVSEFAPERRQQTLHAPVSGRISRWWVQEGAKVEAGETLIELSDIDPEFVARLEAKKRSVEEKIEAKQQQLLALQAQVTNLEANRDLLVATAQNRLEMARQRVRSAEEALESARATFNTAGFQFERMQRLLGEGIVSRRDFEIAERDEIIARRSVNSARAALEAALAEQRAAEAEVEQRRADSQARIESTAGAASRIRADLEDSRLALREMEVRLSRQREQTIKAPRAGTVFRLLGNPTGSVIREGEPLLILVPETAIPAVELWVSGNDAPLISEGRKVRLQFEGWPALQFRGWSELAVGTFGGMVSFVDAADDGSGRFRVMVIPDPEAATPWPSSRFLRQGGRVRGWVLLGKVSLAYEIWRQLNGFPPMEAMEAGPEDLARQRAH